MVCRLPTPLTSEAWAERAVVRAPVLCTGSSKYDISYWKRWMKNQEFIDPFTVAATKCQLNRVGRLPIKLSQVAFLALSVCYNTLTTILKAPDRDKIKSIYWPVLKLLEKPSSSAVRWATPQIWQTLRSLEKVVQNRIIHLKDPSQKLNCNELIP